MVDGRRSPVGRIVALALFVAIGLLPLGFIGAGGWLLYQAEVGRHVTATVDDCYSHSSGRSSTTTCTGHWRLDGVDVTGDVENLDDGTFAGDTIEVTVHGDTAYTRSVTLPIILIGLGIPFAVLPVRWITTRVRTWRAKA